MVAVSSDVGVRRPEKRRWLEIRTATGYRYLSGGAQAVLQQLYLLLLLCGGLTAKLTLLGDGARWIATFFKTPIACWPGSQLIMDWYHHCPSTRLRGCLKSSGCRKPMQHQTRHREVNHRLTTFGQPFIIFAQAA